MTINDLFKAFTDLDFQSNRLMKAKEMDIDNLRQFDERSEQVRLQIRRLDLSISMNEEMDQLGRIDVNYYPEWNFGKKILNVLALGFYKKSHFKSKRHEYFLRAVHQRRQLFLHAENELKQS
jgi:protein tyrosine/serine phosphatase